MIPPVTDKHHDMWCLAPRMCAGVCTQVCIGLGYAGVAREIEGLRAARKIAGLMSGGGHRTVSK